MMDERIVYFPFDLQLFADEGNTGEKTEKATPRKVEEARKKGQVYKSSDLNSAVILLAGSVTIFLTLPYMIDTLRAFTELCLIDRALYDFSSEYLHTLLIEVIITMAKCLLPVLAVTSITALLITCLQVGFVFSGEVLTLKLERLNMVEGAKKIFSKRALVELAKSLFKVTVTGYIVYSVVDKNYLMFARLVDMELAASIRILSQIVYEMALKVGAAFVIIGVLDYLYQKYEYDKSLKMSKYDIKQEYKQTEGDPLLKSRQRQIQRDIAMKRMMSEVPRADVVITNPTHFAVALKYEADVMAAPVVIAKGQDFIALKIKELAHENGVVIVENPPLARTLYAASRIGDLIPEDLFQAVAEVLAFVYKQKRIVL
ncbi:flagellar biosynthesis protein flhb [hydrocarbon metagenome]|uniref:Flagellar biosynthetic protein FlhB n=1 Tax=hydrocarbon metagenome TaxID=938273 RepID=A0A0W8E4L8_9ZZZZ